MILILCGHCFISNKDIMWEEIGHKIERSPMEFYIQRHIFSLTFLKKVLHLVLVMLFEHKILLVVFKTLWNEKKNHLNFSFRLSVSVFYLQYLMQHEVRHSEVYPKLELLNLNLNLETGESPPSPMKNKVLLKSMIKSQGTLLLRLKFVLFWPFLF